MSDRLQEIEALVRDWEGSFVHGDVLLLRLTHVNWLIAEVKRLRSLAATLGQEVDDLKRENNDLRQVVEKTAYSVEWNNYDKGDVWAQCNYCDEGHIMSDEEIRTGPRIKHKEWCCVPKALDNHHPPVV